MTTLATSAPDIATDGTSRSFWIYGDPLEVVLSGDQTGGTYALTCADASPGFRQPLHINHGEDEAVYVLEGEVDALINGNEARHAAGTLLQIPKGVPHAIRNAAQARTRYLTIYTPAGFEQIFAEIGEQITDWSAGPSKAFDPAGLAVVSAAYGLELLGLDPADVA